MKNNSFLVELARSREIFDLRDYSLMRLTRNCSRNAVFMFFKSG